MNRPLIVMGDKTTHGGTVISADVTSDINGKYMARVNDMTVCPRCKGTFPITSGADNMKDGAGNAYARHLDSTACGAKLVSSQVTAYWGSESLSGMGMGMGMGMGSAARDAVAQAGAPGVVAQSPTLCLECLVAAAARGDGIVPRA